MLVLTEYRIGPASDALDSGLQRLGYAWASKLRPPRGSNGTLIVSRRRFVDMGPIAPDLAEPWRLPQVRFGAMRLVGVYMPNLKAKIPYWEAVVAHLAPFAGRSALAIGDFNTCRAYLDEAGAIDGTAYFMDRVQEAGFRDVWRDRNPEKREFSWYSHRKNGFRIDHAFLSPRLARRTRAIGYVHGPREAGLSDHSMMVVSSLFHCHWNHRVP